ncbi:MAG: tyrosyl-tRNA synthetase [Candidatus Omnitrophota bacterium]
MKHNAKAQVEVLSKGISELISEDQLIALISKSIADSAPLTVKAGFDPSSPDIHLGHTVLLNKLRQFQNFGHKVVFIIGDATARIGDPTGRNKLRPRLSEEEIKANAKTYQEQAYKVLIPELTETIYNNYWFGVMGFADMMDLASRVTVSQIIQRDDFQKRLASKAPLSLLELFYPLMQGYDSVKIKADIELGGTDQKFNLLMGRELQKEYGQKPQAVMMLPLLVGLDGKQKMSKSLGNHVGIEDAPNDMFGKIMSISDKQMIEYYQLLTDIDGEAVQKSIDNQSKHPKAAKEDLAGLITARYHSPEDAVRALDNFRNVFSKGNQPDEIKQISAQSGMTLLKLLIETAAVKSGGEARRLISQNAVAINGEVKTDPNEITSLSATPTILKVGKRNYLSVISL